MLRIAKSALVIIFLPILAVYCGKESAGPSIGDFRHPADWTISGHVIAAQTDISLCLTCHGEYFKGGIAGVKCTECHMGDARTLHPLAWGTNIVVQHGNYIIQNGTDATVACSNQYCHGRELQGVAGSGPSCSACHDWPFAHSTDVHHSLFQTEGLLCTDCHQSQWDDTCKCYVFTVITTCQSCHPTAVQSRGRPSSLRTAP